MPSKIKLGTMTLEELRLLIAKTVAELAALEHAPLPLAEAEHQLERGVERLASLYTPDAVLKTFSQAPAPGIDTLQLLLGDPRYDVQHAHAALAALFGDRLLDAWRSRLQALYAADPSSRMPRCRLPSGRHASQALRRPSTTSKWPRRGSSSRRSGVASRSTDAPTRVPRSSSIRRCSRRQRRQPPEARGLSVGAERRAQGAGAPRRRGPKCGVLTGPRTGKPATVPAKDNQRGRDGALAPAPKLF